MKTQDRSRFGVILLVLSAGLAQASEPSKTPPADPCEKWSLDGYRVGMSQDAALALHPGAEARKKDSYHVKVPDYFEGILWFDGKMTVKEWSVTYLGAAKDAVKGTLRDRLGAPLVENAAEALFVKSSGAKTTIWEDRACDAAIVYTEYEKSDLAATHVYISAMLLRAASLDQLRKLPADASTPGVK